MIIAMRSFAIVLLPLLLACVNNGQTASTPQSVTQGDLRDRLDTLQAKHSSVPGFAIAIVLEGETVVSASTGVADPKGRAMLPDTPIRIASVAKTAVAVSILRLWEEGLLALDSPIDGLISSEHSEILSLDGYDISSITVRHLLMHSSGLNDHTSGDAFIGMVLSDPQRVWTRTAQIRLMADTTEPVAAPGQAFSYSDTGYILLGEIIERVTDERLGQAVRRLAKLNTIGLENSWWDEEEPPAAAAPRRAHQWLDEIDTYPIHGSIDAYGGGGLVASVEDVARFYAALFAGQVFSRPETLALMTSAPGRPDDSPYRLGLFERELHGQEAFGHGGFWGVDALVIPDLNVAMAGVALNQRGMDDLL
ncbi:MAG: beta-lactamase family protein, partial [Caulobacterales bacterium]|nr:beta-lactamase family protein [Caulobacterales bacterium]